MSETNGNGSGRLLTRETWMSLGVGLSLASAAGTGGAWLSTILLSTRLEPRLLGIEYAVRDVEREQAQFRVALKDRDGERWTKRDMQQWIDRARASDPEARLPDADR